MKKIKCNACANTWIVEDENLDRQKACPYCLSQLWTTPHITEYDTLGKIIYGAYMKCDKIGALNPHQLCGLMMDLAPQKKTEIRIFSKAVNNTSLAELKTVLDDRQSNYEITLKKYRNRLQTEEGLSDQWLDIICNGFREAASLISGRGSHKCIAAQVTEYIIPQKNVKPAIGKSRKPSSVKQAPVCNCADHFQPENMYCCPICGYIVDGSDICSSKIQECPLCNFPISKAEKWKIASAPEKPDKESLRSTSNPEKFKDILIRAQNASDDEKKLQLYKDAAGQGYVPACTMVGAIYHRQKNYRNAWKWFLKAADHGDSEGLYYVGYYYQNGYHVKKDLSLAIKNFEKAADLHSAKALQALSKCYASGDGCEINQEKSKDYAARSAAMEIYQKRMRE